MRYAAFLRGMNVGGHRITNADLRAHIEGLGFRDVAVFLGSGNVVLEAGRKQNVAGRIERGLRAALGYDVPTILRTPAEVREIAAREVFDEAIVARSGKEHVWLLAERPSDAAVEALRELTAGGDLLEVIGSELHWLPPGGVLESKVTLAKVVRLAGLATVRTRNTLVRLAQKHFPE